MYQVHLNLNRVPSNHLSDQGSVSPYSGGTQLICSVAQQRKLWFSWSQRAPRFFPSLVQKAVPYSHKKQYLFWCWSCSVKSCERVLYWLFLVNNENPLFC